MSESTTTRAAASGRDLPPGAVGKYYVTFGKHKHPGVAIPIISGHGKIVAMDTGKTAAEETGRYVVEDYDLLDPNKASVRVVSGSALQWGMLFLSYRAMRTWYEDVYLPVIRDEYRR